MTHAALVEAARRWLWRQCSVVITEMANMGGEEADAIGWQGTLCRLVECKATLADFRADADKSFRRFPPIGLGEHRYYCTPPALLKPSMLPPLWGLIEWSGTRMRTVVKAQVHPESGKRKEIALLLSALRRTGTHAPSGVSVKVYTMQTQCRASLSVMPEDTGAAYDALGVAFET